MTANALIIQPDEGRIYEMGRMRAIFKADNAETANRYSISEWWLEPRTRGPGTHSHSDDHLFYVIEGTLHLSIGGGDWLPLGKGGYAVIPGGTPHDFRNQTDTRAGFISINVPRRLRDADDAHRAGHGGGRPVALTAADSRRPIYVAVTPDLIRGDAFPS